MDLTHDSLYDTFEGNTEPEGGTVYIRPPGLARVGLNRLAKSQGEPCPRDQRPGASAGGPDFVSERTQPGRATLEILSGLAPPVPAHAIPDFDICQSKRFPWRSHSRLYIEQL